jgi:hypothetical protein
MSTVELPRDGVELGLPDTPPAPDELFDLVARTFPGIGGGRLVRLRRGPGPGLVRVEVEDGSPSRLPVLGRVDTPAHGRGLVMVNRLSVNWGHQPRGDHKTVWAEVRLA